MVSFLLICSDNTICFERYMEDCIRIPTQPPDNACDVNEYKDIELYPGTFTRVYVCYNFVDYDGIYYKFPSCKITDNTSWQRSHIICGNLLSSQTVKILQSTRSYL